MNITRSIFSIYACIYVCGVLMTGCNTSAKEGDGTRGEIVETQADFDEATHAYLMEVRTYRKETEERIAANDSIIQVLKSKIAGRKQQARTEYAKKVTELEQKNDALKKKMGDFREDGKEQWESFKAEVNHDMNELEKAFRDLTTDNIK